MENARLAKHARIDTRPLIVVGTHGIGVHSQLALQVADRLHGFLDQSSQPPLHISEFLLVVAEALLDTSLVSFFAGTTRLPQHWEQASHEPCRAPTANCGHRPHPSVAVL